MHIMMIFLPLAFYIREPFDRLKVYAMEWCWAFIRKLDRFNEKNKKDIIALLTYRNHPAIGIAQKGEMG